MRGRIDDITLRIDRIRGRIAEMRPLAAAQK